jgi:hypothetical protein
MSVFMSLAYQIRRNIKSGLYFKSFINITLSENLPALSHLGLCFQRQFIDKLDSLITIVLISFRLSLSLFNSKSSLNILMQILILSFNLF